MGGDQDLVAVEIRFGRDVVAHVAEDRATHREVGRRFQVEQARQQACKAGGVEDEIGFDAVLAAIRAAHVHHRLFARLDRQHFIAETQGRAHALGATRQHVVEVGALHLVGGAPARRELLPEVERGARFPVHEGRAVLVLEARLDHVLQ
ncbi:hypothetical protein D3C72_1604460 [compost metagenome]